MPTRTLENLLTVGNFSSPHQFRFEDGSILDACHPDRVKASSLLAKEDEYTEPIHGVEVTHVDLSFLLTKEVADMLIETAKEWKAGLVDIVLVPLPVLRAFQAEGERVDRLHCSELLNRLPDGCHPDDYMSHPFRTVRVKDRQTKTLFVDRFCV